MPHEDCNFRCVYCYESFKNNLMQESIQDGIINYVSKNISKYRVLKIQWFGGEPLLALEVIRKLSKQFIDLARENNVKYFASMTTNGYLLNIDIFRELINLGISTFQITLDGIAKTHDRHRIGRNGENTFERIFMNLKSIKQDKNYFQIILRSNIDHDVLSSMTEYLTLMKENFIDDKRFLLHFIPILNLKGDNFTNIHLTDTKDLFPIYEEAKKMGFSFKYYKNFLRPGGMECYASKPNSFIIGSDGNIYKCTVAFNNPLNQVGFLNKEGKMEIDEYKIALWISSGSEDTNCKQCTFRPVCNGNACPLERLETNNTPCPPVKKNLKKYIILVGEDKKYE